MGLMRWSVVVTAVFAGCAPSVHDLAGRGRVEELAARLDADAAALEARNDLEKTPLFYAVTYRWPQSTALLIERGADVNARDVTGYTPLHVAATLNRTEEAGLLVEAGADVDAKDDFGDTPLHSAAIHGQVDMIRWLVEHGANPRALNAEGKTPVDLAREQYKDEAARVLEAMSPAERPVRSQ